MIRSIIERTGVKIDVEDDGRVNVASADGPAAQKAISIIQELTATGLNLEGVRRVLALEAEVARLRFELISLQQEAREAVERVHRHYRRDLVPLEQTPVLYRGGRR